MKISASIGAGGTIIPGDTNVRKISFTHVDPNWAEAVHTRTYRGDGLQSASPVLLKGSVERLVLGKLGLDLKRTVAIKKDNVVCGVSPTLL